MRMIISKHKPWIGKKTKPISFGTRLAYKLAKGERNNKTGKWIKEELISLGPTYIKIGQIVSSRSDLFPKYITDELKSLQDDVPSFEYNEVEQIIEEELNAKIDDHFESFSKQPVASASIAQVHSAILKTTGKKVAVKIQRPNIKNNFNEDLYFINMVFEVLSKFNNKNISDILIILKECTESIEQEVDFRNEMINMSIFYKIFKNDETVKVPRVYSKLTTNRMLVMEYVEGIKINDMESIKKHEIDAQKLAKQLMYTFIKITLDYGILHGDPHPGNISVSENGDIILYDYGIISKFEKNIQNTFKKVLNAFIENDIEEIMNLLLENDIIYTTPNKKYNNKDLNYDEYIVLYKIIEYVIEYTRTLDIKQLSKSIMDDKDIDEKNIPYVFNSNMILLFKTMTTLEGVCKTLDDEFTYDSLLMDIAGKYIDEEFVFRKMTKDVNKIMDGFRPELSNNEDHLKNLKMRKIESKLDDQGNMMKLLVFLALLKTILL